MSGITDKEAIESHVPIHNPDVDEQKLHEQDDAVKREAGQSDPLMDNPVGEAEGEHKKSTIDKVKDSFHRQARRAENGP
ncbi:unnamed protein product [Penicillium crustosum]